MSIAEAKSLIHKLVVETNDIKILQQVADFFNILKSKNEDWWDDLSEDQQQLINKGLEQMKQANFISHSQARQKIQQLIQQKKQ